jgi:SAM-dependent methyltransferase
MQSSGPNAAQIEFWNGDAARAWTDNQARMDALLSPLSARALAVLAVRSGERVLDVGCGCGGTTLELAASGARATGIDISEAMLALARKRAAGAAKPQPDFVLADASTHRFEPVFDAFFSRFGVMFFADAVAAFANLRTALKPGGRLSFVCWQAPRDNPWIAVPVGAARAHLPEPPPADPRAPGPFAFADRAYLNEVLTKAGFDSVALEPFEATLALGASVDEAIEFTARVGPLSRALADAPADARERALIAVRDALRPVADASGAVRLGARVWIATARSARA